MQQHFLPPSTDTTSNVSIHTLSSSSNAILNPTPSLYQHTSTSTSQIITTTEILPTSNSPNHYTTPSNTTPAVPYNTVQPSALQIPVLPPIPLSLNNTFPHSPSLKIPHLLPPMILLYLIKTHYLLLLYHQFLLSLKLFLLPPNPLRTTLIFLSILLFKTSPLILSNPLQTP